MRIRQITIALTLAALLAALVGCDSSTDTGSAAKAPGVPVEVSGKITPGKWVGSAAPGFAAPDIEGAPFTLADTLAVKPAVVVFWATWCPSCVAEVPHLIALREKVGDRVAFIGVATKDKLDAVKSFVQDKAVPYTIVNDPKAEIALAYGFNGVPSVVLVGRDGTIVFSGSTDVAALEEAIKALPEGG